MRKAKILTVGFVAYMVVSAVFWAVSFNVLYPKYPDWIRLFSFPIIYTDYPDPDIFPVPELHLFGREGEPATPTKLALAGGWFGFCLGVVPAGFWFLVGLVLVARQDLTNVWAWALVNGLVGVGVSIYLLSKAISSIKLLQ